MAHRGHGLARTEEGWLRIPGTDLGELVRLEPFTDRWNRRWGRLVEVLEPSPDRVEPFCPRFPDCPGCALIHLTPRAQTARKVAALDRTLRRLAGIEDPPLAPARAARRRRAYRRRGSPRLLEGSAGPVLGLSGRPWSPEPVDLADCPAQTPGLNRRLAEVKAALARIEDPDRRLTGASVWADGPVILRVSSPRDPSLAGRIAEALPGSVAVEWEHRDETELLRGKGSTTFRVGDFPLRASLESWTPVGAEGARLLVETAVELLEPGPGCRILELGCGVGTVSLALAAAGATVTGADLVRAAVADAQANGTRLGIPAVFRVGKAHRALRRLAAGGERYDAVLLHGMRRPFGPETLDLIPTTGARRLLLASPAPASLARDLKHLIGYGWHPRTIRPIDQLPGTHHLMGVVLLKRA